MGNVILSFADKSEVTDYRRELDLKTGIARVTYTQNGIHFKREVFASYPDQAVVMRLSADKQGVISFECQLQGVRNQAHSNYATDYFHTDLWGNNGLRLTGKGADYLGIEGKIRYEARLKARLKGGRASTSIRSLYVQDADEVVLILVAATSFKSYKDVDGNCRRRVEDYFSHLAGLDYEQLKDTHIKDHLALFGRVTLELPPGKNSDLPTDVRMQKIKDEPDPSLAALCYQFGRYIMIASSRRGTEATNLQGI